MELGEELQNRGYAEQLLLKSPDIRMRITDQRGDDITTAMVGRSVQSGVMTVMHVSQLSN